MKRRERDVAIAHKGLLKLVQSKEPLTIAVQPLLKITPKKSPLVGIPELDYYSNWVSLADASHGYERQKLLPDISLNYFQGTNPDLNDHLHGYQVGLKIPLLFGGRSSRIKASKIATDIVLEESKSYNIQLNARLEVLQSELKKYETALAYYENEGTMLSDEILKTANGSFKNGEIDFYQYILSLENAYEVHLEFLDNLNLYNQTAIKINYITF